MPQLRRVCEEVESGSISLAKTCSGRSRSPHIFGQQSLLGFHLRDLALIRFDDGAAARVNDALKQLVDLAANLRHVAPHDCKVITNFSSAFIPGLAEHLEGHVEHALARTQFFEQLFKIALDVLAANDLAAARAAARVAQVIGIVSAAPLRPARRIRLPAIAACHEPSQGKICAQVFTGRSLRHPKMTILHCKPGGERDQRLMLGWHQMQAPLLVRQMPGVDWASKQLVDALLMDLAFFVLWPGRLRLQKALYLDDGFEPAGRIPFKSLGDDGRIRLIGHEQFAVSLHDLETVANRSLGNAVTVLGTGTHPVVGLLRIFLPLMLRHRRQQVFAKDAIGIRSELDRRAFQFAACFGQQIAQIPVSANVTRKTVDVVDDDDIPFRAVLLEKLQHRLHGGAVGFSTGGIILEDLDHLTVLIASILAAARLLATQTIALAHLLSARTDRTEELNRFLAEMPIAAIDPPSWLAAARVWYDPLLERERSSTIAYSDPSKRKRRGVWSTEMIARSWRTMHAVARRPVDDWWDISYEVLGQSTPGRRNKVSLYKEPTAARRDPMVRRVASEVLDRFFGDFQSLLEQSPPESVARRFATQGWKNIPGGEFRMGSPENQQGFPDKTRAFWKRHIQLALRSTDLDALATKTTPDSWWSGPYGRRAQKEEVDWLISKVFQPYRAAAVVGPEEQARVEPIIMKRLQDNFRRADETPFEEWQNVKPFVFNVLPVTNEVYALFGLGHIEDVRKEIADAQAGQAGDYPVEDRQLMSGDGDHEWDRPERPAIYINWFDAWVFAQWARWRQDGVEYRCRLPHEPEWEWGLQAHARAAGERNREPVWPALLEGAGVLPAPRSAGRRKHLDP